MNAPGPLAILALAPDRVDRPCGEADRAAAEPGPAAGLRSSRVPDGHMHMMVMRILAGVPAPHPWAWSAVAGHDPPVPDDIGNTRIAPLSDLGGQPVAVAPATWVVGHVDGPDHPTRTAVRIMIRFASLMACVTDAAVASLAAAGCPRLAADRLPGRVRSPRRIR
jgi:hypothetical protein